MDHQPNVEQLQQEIFNLKNKLKLSEEAFLNIVNKNKDGILIINNLGVIVYANQASVDLFGRNIGDLLGEKIGLFINPDIPTEITIVHKERGLVHLETTIADTLWQHEPAKLANLHDVTEHKKLEQLLKHLVHHDYLTNLTNRNYFEIKLEESIRDAEQNIKKFALLYLDLDGFKAVNDTFGHQTGDALLIQIAKLLKTSIRECDIVSRLGGDEFAIILNNIKSRMDVEKIALKILNLVNQPLQIDSHSIHVNFSIGITIYPDNGTTSNELIKKSDKAMYQAKKSGPGQFYFS